MELSSKRRIPGLYYKPMEHVPVKPNGAEGIYDIDEIAITHAPRAMQGMYWTMAGMQLTDALRTTLGLPTEEQEKSAQRLKKLITKENSTRPLSEEEKHELEALRVRDDLYADIEEKLIIEPVLAIRIPHTHHDYTIARNRLVPYYPPEKESLNRRKEEKIIGRSRSWIINALPQVNVPWTKQDIDYELGKFRESLNYLNPDSADDLNEKSAAFRLIFGAIMTRFELLGRATTQGNTFGTKGVIPPAGESYDPESPLLPFELQPVEPKILDNEQLSPEQIKGLEAEYQHYCRLLMSRETEPFLRLALLKDMKIDRDGILIDYMREVSKPIRVTQEDQDQNISTLNIDKIGSAMASIDETHAILRKAMTEGASGVIFKDAATQFIRIHGREYGLNDTDGIIQRLDDYAALCKARTSIKGEDAAAYAETYAKLSALEAFFNGQNGLLQSMRRASQGHSKDLAELRQLTTRGVKLMLQTAYTRIPSNSDAPSVWIPNLDDNAPPLERNLADQFLTHREIQQAQEILKEAKQIEENGGDKERFLNAEFCSVGCLRREMKLLEQSIAESQTKNESRKTHPRIAGGSHGQDTTNTGRG